MPLEDISRRSAILRKALKFINKDDWTDYGTFMVFGPAPRPVGTLPARPPSYRFMSYDEFSEALSGYLGLTLSKERTTVGRRPDDSEFLERLQALPQDTRKLINEGLFDGEIADPTPENILHQIKEAIASKNEREALKGGSILPEHKIDDLDSWYCQEVLDKLDLIASRVAGLEAVRIKRMPNAKVRRCFEEAMRCYLYGFDLACLAMCRAMIEAVLKEVIDPHRQYRPSKNMKGREASYFLKLVDLAEHNGRLGGDLVKPAEKIKEAGDDAVHNANVFPRKYPAEKVQEILLRTRQILLKLYRKPSSAI